MKRSSIRLFIIWLNLLIIVNPSLSFVSAQTTSPTLIINEDNFDPNYILQDDDIFDATSMDHDDIQKFLDKKGSLGSFQGQDIDGIFKSAADIIWRVSQDYKINPKYLLALLQKEQSLVEGRAPDAKAFDWATGFAVCDSCDKNDPAIQNFKGFANQLEYAAKQHREKYLYQILTQGKTISGYAPKKTSIVDGQKITPVNRATAMLYSYTPHIHGNVNLWKIWQRWFSLQFPDGSVVLAKDTNTYYLIRFGKKRQIKNRSVVASITDLSKVITTSESSLSGYSLGQPVSFPNYSIIETEDKKRYLINGDKKRLIVNNKVFQKLGFVEDDILEGTNEELADYTDGSDITDKSIYPWGSLAKDPQGSIWYIEDGVKHAVQDKIFLKLYFNQRPTKAITKAKLDEFKHGDPIKLHDGELVKSDAKGSTAVYVIEGGQKRPIPSGEIFEELGWQWKNVLTINKKLLDNYPLGLAVNPHFSFAVETSEEENPISTQEAKIDSANTAIASTNP